LGVFSFDYSNSFTLGTMTDLTIKQIKEFENKLKKYEKKIKKLEKIV